MHSTPHRYFILHKPPNMVSQFVSSHEVTLLGDIHFSFPEGTHAIGRLDSHSEGLLILTTDKTITKRLFQGAVPHVRTYLVQVKHVVTQQVIEQLQQGISIQVKGGGYYTTAPCNAVLVSNPADYINVETPAIIYEPTSWLLLSLTEGKFHQVRKMVHAVGHRCKRLIRISIEDLMLGNLKPGEVKELEAADFFRKVNIER